MGCDCIFLCVCVQETEAGAPWKWGFHSDSRWGKQIISRNSLLWWPFRLYHKCVQNWTPCGDLLYVEYTISPGHTQQGTLMKFNTLEQGQMFLSKQMNLEDQIALRPERYDAGWEEAKGIPTSMAQVWHKVNPNKYGTRILMISVISSIKYMKVGSWTSWRLFV